MQIKNLSKSALTLPTGEVIKAGDTATVKDFDEKQHVIAAWLEAGLIDKSTAKAKAETEADETAEVETEKSQAKTKTAAKE